MATTNTTANLARRTGPLLVAGGVLWLTGFAGLPILAGAEGAEAIYEAADRADQYRAIAAHPDAFRWTNFLFLLGTLVAGLGFIGLARLLGEGTLPRLALGAYAVGAVAWLIEILGRMTITVSQAREVAAGEPIPTAFPASIGFDPLFFVFSLALLGIALFGVAVMRSDIAGRWGRWPVGGLLVAGAALGIIAQVPALAFLVGATPAGLALLVRGLRQTGARARAALT